MRAYTGIGSRETPKDVLHEFIRLGCWLANQGYALRSGHADGADMAFEIGCGDAGGVSEIYLPWSGFNGSRSALVLKEDDEAMEIAKKYHPAFDRLSPGAKKLQARNTYQIMGYHLDELSKFVICWTKNGSGSGGTGQAIRIAKDLGVPVFDCGRYMNIEETRAEFTRFFERVSGA